MLNLQDRGPLCTKCIAKRLFKNLFTFNTKKSLKRQIPFKSWVSAVAGLFGYIAVTTCCNIKSKHIHVLFYCSPITKHCKSHCSSNKTGTYHSCHLLNTHLSICIAFIEMWREKRKLWSKYIWTKNGDFGIDIRLIMNRVLEYSQADFASPGL